MDNNFQVDHVWQTRKRDEYLVPLFYKKYAFRYQFVSSTDLQRKGIDTIVQWREGASSWFIDEKIVRWPKDRGIAYDAFCLETDSCTVVGYESPGWMYYSKMDLLFYCFETKTLGLDCYLIQFPQLREWFFQNELTFSPFKMEKTINKTAGRVVPIVDVLMNRNIVSRRFELEK